MLATDTSSDFPLEPIFSERPKSFETGVDDAGPEMLCGELWREGEMALIFGDQGVGNSLLAVQIGEAVARGEGFGPFEAPGGPRKVLFLDLQHTDRQFRARYSADPDDETAENHVFSDNFDIMAVDVGARLPDGGSSFCDYFCRAVERLVVEKDADVLIIDNLAYLKHSNDIVRDVMPLVRVLNRLKRTRGLSVLLVAQGQKRLASRGLTYHDMQGGKMLCNYVDSVFAVGEGIGGERYIKQLASKSAEIMYDKTLVPVFRIEKIDGNFLGFVFGHFTAEKAFFEVRRDEIDWPLIDRIKQMHDDDGISLRDIAIKTGRSKTTVHRLLQMWKPEKPGAAAVKEYDPTTSPFYFPGKEEYDEADRDPKFKNLGEGPEYALLNREQYLIQWTRAKAKQEFDKTGIAPTLAEMKQRLPEWQQLFAAQAAEAAAQSEPPAVAGGLTQRSVEAAAASRELEEWEECGFEKPFYLDESEPPAVAGGLTRGKVNTNGSDETCYHESNGSQLQPPAIAGGSDKAGHRLITDLKRGVDHNDMEIFIESEDERGKPKVWYWRDKKRIWHRAERDMWGVTNKPLGRDPMFR